MEVKYRLQQGPESTFDNLCTLLYRLSFQVATRYFHQHAAVPCHSEEIACRQSALSSKTEFLPRSKLFLRVFPWSLVVVGAAEPLC